MKIVVYFFLVVLAIIAIIPFYLVMVNASWPSFDIVSSLKLVPGTNFLENYFALIEHADIWRSFFNSIFISMACVILTCYFATLAGYGFAKYRLKGGRILFFIVLASMMLPSQLSIIGFYFLNLRLGLLNTFYPLILPSIANASAVFFLQGMIKDTISDSYIEAARIEGAGELRIFHSIAIPLVSPGIATIGILNFVNSWNSYMTPLIILSDEKKFTMPILISVVKGVYLSNYGAMYMAIFISVIPIIIIYCFLSRYIINGLTIGGIK